MFHNLKEPNIVVLCGSQENLQRQAIKQMLLGWDQQQPGRVENIARSIGHLTPSHLADHGLFDFKGLGIAGNNRESDQLSGVTSDRISLREI